MDFGNQLKQLLYVDFRIVCDSDYHSLWVKKLVSPVMIMFVLGFPIYIVVKMLIETRKSTTNGFKFQFSFFYYAYERQLFFWDVVILMRKLLLIFINSFFFSRITDQVEFYPILIVIMVFSAAFGLQVYFKPFAQNEFNIINGIEEYSLLVSFYTTLIALVYLIADNLGPNATLGLLLLGLFMNISFFAFWIRLYIKYNDSLLNILKWFIGRYFLYNFNIFLFNDDFF